MGHTKHGVGGVDSVRGREWERETYPLDEEFLGQEREKEEESGDELVHFFVVVLRSDSEKAERGRICVMSQRRLLLYPWLAPLSVSHILVRALRCGGDKEGMQEHFPITMQQLSLGHCECPVRSLSLNSCSQGRKEINTTLCLSLILLRPLVCFHLLPRCECNACTCRAGFRFYNPPGLVLCG